MPEEFDLHTLVANGRFEEVEARWLAQLEASPIDTEFFTDALQTLVASGQESRTGPLVQLLLEAIESDPPAALAFTTQALDVWPQSPELRAALFGAVRRTYADRPSLERLLQHFKAAEAHDPRSVLSQVETWLRFDVGRAVIVQGRGLGRVAEILPALGSLRVDLPDTPRMTFKLGEAEHVLTALEPGHILLEKLDRPEELRALADSDPGALLEKVFESAPGPLAMGEIRELLSGVVPEERWTGWWKRAAGDPRLASTGGKRPTYTWSASGAEADDTLRRTFERAEPRAKLELARKHAGRSPGLASTLGRGILAVAREAENGNPSLALEAWLTLERVDVGGASIASKAITVLIGAADPVPLVGGVEERSLRERAIALLRQNREDWPALAVRLLRTETDTRTLTLLYEMLQRDGGEALLQSTVDEVLSRPHTAPRLFVWLCRELRRRPELDARGDWPLLRRILDAPTSEAFRGLRGPLRELFDPGEVAVELAGRLERDQAEQLQAMLARELGLEEHRKELLRRTVIARHPVLRESDAEEELIYTTAEGLERKRAEFEQITKRDIPHNAEEIRKAAAHGDLRENFEYKAARDKHEMLSSRAKSLHDELRRARAIDPATIDPSCVRVGTRIVLEPEAGGETRSLVILGPWDSDPARGVVSYLAPAVHALLGKARGDRVEFLDGRFAVGSIEVWRRPE